jgi:hypothetical protein
MKDGPSSPPRWGRFMLARVGRTAAMAAGRASRGWGPLPTPSKVVSAGNLRHFFTHFLN